MYKKTIFAVSILFASLVYNPNLQAQAKCINDEIKMFAGNFVPQGYQLYLEGRTPIGVGGKIVNGSKVGKKSITLKESQLPELVYEIPAYNINDDEEHNYTHGSNAFISVANEHTSSISISKNTAVNLMQPSLCINFIICVDGIEPERN